MATMKDVAKTAGVSIATVSATLSGAAYVSPELKARVHAAIESLGYERNSMASGLKRGRTSLIGLVVSDVTNPFFTEFVDQVQTTATAAGWSVLLGISNHDPAREAELLRLMRSHQAAATILCPTGGASDYAPDRFPLGRMRLVAVDNASPDMPFDTVSLDNREAARLAADHILAAGHTRVATVSGTPRQYVAGERLAGFRAALAERGMSQDPELERPGNFRIEDAVTACRDLLALAERPTAIFVANNLMLIGVMQALAEAGLSVPGDMSIASIDDFPWANAFRPALTVVRQPIADMAATVFERLLERLEGDDAAPVHTVLPPTLVVRGSVAPWPVPVGS
jgi:LacI family transcriptional regulator